ncbi:hypothetical protein IGI04_030514 [Brassica rapa subsp. trilocularis]|uniref:Uncharacterized protein n=1 Tax=Brassica rapa subsp. trilocularis TaxID=1813537 RepID=A0ABQ7LQY4_BRACM|nr:hypothetical protein IGI04_030514 [Brassica rapa subsp. trilocularis]
MELYPNSLNRSNQFCNCLIWSLTGSILVKPNNGDQESDSGGVRILTMHRSPDDQEDLFMATLFLFGVSSIQTTTVLFPIKIGPISIHTSAVKKFPKNSLTALNRPDTKPSSQLLNQAI